MEAGDLERAAALSERALRIAPREALLWYRLAEIRYRQQRYDEALGFAQRAQSLAGSNSGLQRDSVRLQELSAAAAAR
ncbi:MAG TPA: tetratricopeptide repeat protein [Pseudomonadaceae bacterium]|nr:tetratricopeptide repeat protein [Pseudomonadaceae bacterium]